MANLHICLLVTICLAVSLLLIPSKCEAAFAEVAKVKCTVLFEFTSNFYEDYDQCYIKMQKEMRENKEETENKEDIPNLYNVTIESFELDDHCLKHCAYKAVGLLSNDDIVPKKTQTTSIFVQDRISDEHFKKITSIWDDCLVLSEQIGKKKDWNSCKSVTHHFFCFQTKLGEIEPSLQIDC